MLVGVLVGNPHAMVYGPLTQSLLFGKAVNLGDDHVATVAVPSFQIAASRRVVLNRRNHFQKIPAHGHQVVGQTKLGYTGVDIAAVNTQYAAQIIHYRVEVIGD
jgi:hypothetical protein